MSVFDSVNFKQRQVVLLKSAYAIKQTPDDTCQNTYNIIKCQVALWMCNIKQMCLKTALENVNGLSTLDGDRERAPDGRGSHSAVLCMKMKTKTDVMDERDFTRFRFKMSFGRIYFIAQHSCLLVRVKYYAIAAILLLILCPGFLITQEID